MPKKKKCSRMTCLRQLLQNLSLASTEDKIVILISENHFGHIVNRIDFFQRVIAERKLLVVITTCKLDSSVIEYFESSASKIVPIYVSNNKIFSKISYVLSRYMVSLIAKLFFKQRAIINTNWTYYLNFKTSSTVRVYSEKRKKLVNYHSPSNQLFINRHLNNSNLGLSNTSKKIALQKIFGSTRDQSRNNKGIIGIKLRDVHYKSHEFHDENRNSKNINTYNYLIDFLLERGYQIVIDSTQKLNEPRDNVFEIRELGDQTLKGLLRTYILTEADFILQQHSGPVHLANIAGVPNITIDSFPLWQGTWSKDDFIVPQQVVLLATGKRLSFTEIAREHPDLFFGNYNKDMYEFLPSEQSYIISCILELEANLKNMSNEPAHTTNKMLRLEYNKFIPNQALCKHSPSKYPIAMITNDDYFMINRGYPFA